MSHIINTGSSCRAAFLSYSCCRAFLCVLTYGWAWVWRQRWTLTQYGSSIKKENLKYRIGECRAARIFLFHSSEGIFTVSFPTVTNALRYTSIQSRSPGYSRSSTLILPSNSSLSACLHPESAVPSRFALTGSCFLPRHSKSTHFLWRHRQGQLNRHSSSPNNFYSVQQGF